MSHPTGHPAPTHPGHDHPFAVTVRTLAGHSQHEEVRGSETVATLTSKAVAHFVDHHQLEAGSYTLSLPRLGQAAGLDPTGTLQDVGVVAHDMLVLVSRSPQVDG